VVGIFRGEPGLNAKAARADAGISGFQANAREACADLVAHWRRPLAPVAALWPLWLALAVFAFSLMLFIGVYFDVPAAHWAKRLDLGLVIFFNQVTQLGKSNWLFALSILTILYALSRSARAAALRLRTAWGLVASYALYFLAVQAFSGTASQVVKHMVGRARPYLIDQFGPHHFDLFSWSATLASFPSGHTTTVFAAFGALTLLSPRFGPWFLLLAIPVAASRIIVGAHYPSDVCGGFFLGLASALIVARIFARRKIAFTIAPEALLPKPRGGAFLSATWSEARRQG
jgi:membrane-associated phospholipid phosphatase